MMSKIRVLLACAALVLGGAAASAQAPAPTTGPGTRGPSSEPPCPRGRLSIYFASGEATASPQAEALITRISEHAASCNADGLDLVARIDVRVDGDRALALALQRLGAIADGLIASGIPVDRIRLGALGASSPAAPNLNQIDILIRKADDVIGEVASPPAASTFSAAPASAI
jgi:outer membrane protein OmpA-like peptidoglycan-associated protein